MSTEHPTGKRLTTFRLHNELFVISQNYGNAVYHRMAEIVPRLALYLDFLKANPNVMIHAPEGPGGRLGELLNVMGLNKTRLVSGVLRSRVAYMPPGIFCSNASIAESQTMSKLYDAYIGANFPAQPRNRLVLIRRSRGSRRFTRQMEIENVVRRAAADHQLNYTLFADNPTPSLNDTMQIFHSAAVVVAPHGAGLSNIYFSQPGTFVIEGVCNVPHVNMCFQRLAHVLGHHWHGLASRGGCRDVINVSEKSIDLALRQHIRLLNVQQP